MSIEKTTDINPSRNCVTRFQPDAWYSAQVDGTKWIMRYSHTQKVELSTTPDPSYNNYNYIHVSPLITGDTLQEDTVISNSQIEAMMTPIEQSEVDQALLNVLMKKGYVLGAKVKLWNSADSITHVKLIDHNTLLYSDDLQNIMMGDVMVRSKGEWLDIISPQKTIIEKLNNVLDANHDGKHQYLVDVLLYTIESYEKHYGDNGQKHCWGHS
jgi:hypothetical protein